MTAKEMFKNKGFNIEKSYDGELITYIRIQLVGDYENHYGITFNLESKAYHTWYFGYNKGECIHNMNLAIDVELFKAIHQQLKELKWLDE